MDTLNLEMGQRELIQSAINKNSIAIGKLYVYLRPLIRATIKKAIFNISRDEINDMVQDLVIKVIYEKLHLFQTGKPLKPWVQKICYNYCTDYFRKRRNCFYGNNERILPDENTWQFVSPNNNPEEQLMSSEKSDTISKILNELNPAKLELLFSYAYRERPLKNIAQDLGKSVGSITTEFCRLKKKFKKQLELQGEK